MKTLGSLLKSAQEMQERMLEMQERLAAIEVTGKAGAGLVSVTLDGRGEAREVRIDPSLLDGNDRTVVEDLVKAALNDARTKANARMQEEMTKAAGGVPLPPGVTLPF